MLHSLQRIWAPLRRALYLVHRWLGIAGCLLFVLWFVSGLVMLHVRFPTLTLHERLSGLQPLKLEEVLVAPADALRKLQIAHPRKVVLERQGAGGMVWRILDPYGGHHVVAASGPDLGREGVSPAEAQAIASAFGGATARFMETRDRDQWTMPNANAFEQARPLHRLALDDAAGTELYVSAKTGEVVRDTTAHERLWTMFGTLLHYYTYAPIRKHADFWRQLVLWTSGLAMISAATGLVVGLLRVRVRSKYRRGTSITPYRGWMAWHHIAGLLGGMAILTWVFSGWFSMSPNQWLARPVDTGLAARFGGASTVFTHRIDSLRNVRLPKDGIKSVEAGWFDSRPIWTSVDAQGVRHAFDALDARPVQVTREALGRAVQAGFPGVPIESVALLSAPDRYWYGRHVPPALPVWRIRLADPSATWLHVDAESGLLLGTSTSASRLRRLLFNGLHSLDFFPSLLKTPVWYAAIWALSIAGLCVSVSGVVLGLRSLGRRRPRDEIVRQ